MASSHRDTGVVIGPVRWGVGSVSAEAVRREGNDMTKQRTFKRRVRSGWRRPARATRPRAGTSSRRPRVVPADFEPPVTEPALIEASGHGWEHWLAELDAWGALEHSHRDIAAWLREERGVPGWYAQAITVGFERARGRRAVGQRGGVWVAGATKTVHVPVERLFAAWEETRAARGPARADGHGAADRPLRLGRRRLARRSSCSRPRGTRRAGSRSRTSGWRTPTRSPRIRRTGASASRRSPRSWPKAEARRVETGGGRRQRASAAPTVSVWQRRRGRSAPSPAPTPTASPRGRRPARRVG